MIKVTKFITRTFDLDHVDLYWEIEDITDVNDVITAYDFYMLRSESPEGPFDTIAGPFNDQYHFRDAEPNLLHKWRKLFYKLRVVHKPTSEEEFFGSTGLFSEPDLIALEIQRQEDILFREHAGKRCFLFPIRTFGARCFCWDANLGRRTRSKCPTCYDVGFLGGFLSPIECWVQIDPNPDSPSLTAMQGESQPKNTSARLIAYPPFKPKDILVESTNKRWRVVTANRTERLRAAVHQELTLHAVVPGDIEFSLPINLADLETQQFSAERNFTNPQHTGDGSVLPTVVPTLTPSTEEQRFKFVVPSTGDLFVVTMPESMPDTSYVVRTTISFVPEGGATATLVAKSFGRTRTQFTLESSGDLMVGTVIDISVGDF